jgi:hypothetical protein
MPLPLLPQQIHPVDARQKELTDRLLLPQTDALMEYFLGVRRELDRTFSVQLPPAGGKPYPYGRCEEITGAVLAHLQRALQAPRHPVEHILREFLLAGGAVRSIWGVLRGIYFQNALQFGGLYIDVSNDTVVVTKPKVEILPIEACGLENVRDIDHFVATAASYWGASIFANTLVPGLAPILPMITVAPGKLLPGLQSACDYMIELMCRDEFRQAEAWLLAAPEPSEDAREFITRTLPPDLAAKTIDGRGEALAACRAARAAGRGHDAEWRGARIRDYLRSREPAAVAKPVARAAESPSVTSAQRLLNTSFW